MHGPSASEPGLNFWIQVCSFYLARDLLSWLSTGARQHCQGAAICPNLNGVLGVRPEPGGSSPCKADHHSSHFTDEETRVRCKSSPRTPQLGDSQVGGALLA
jgi:hypothetical protein